jgi:UDP-N-acetylmuramoyl-tripeptide--D-alanyl-D-alanine ligase
VRASYATLDRVTDPAIRPRPEGDVADPRLTAGDLVEATGGVLLATSSRPILGGAVDSREVISGNLFVALPGEHVDGHAYVAAAIEAGAAAAIVARPPDGVALEDVDATVVQVADPLHALHAVAAGWRRRFDPLVVGVTGSIAKTSTKEAIATVLASELVTL